MANVNGHHSSWQRDILHYLPVGQTEWTDHVLVLIVVGEGKTEAGCNDGGDNRVDLASI